MDSSLFADDTTLSICDDNLSQTIAYFSQKLIDIPRLGEI